MFRVRPRDTRPTPLKRHHCFLWAPYGPDRMGGDRGGPHCTCRLDGMLHALDIFTCFRTLEG